MNAPDPTSEAPALEPSVLALAVAEMTQTQHAYEASCEKVWLQVCAQEPALAEALVKLGMGPTHAAYWLCAKDPRDEPSPVQRVLMGQTQDVLAQLSRVAHGLF